ncbi:MAG: serine/threonine protein kinase, partial [Deltaproteobacteria bacterium]|nr:serine/threonine protein kinase [Deltaproteobacteria bacterium]
MMGAAEAGQMVGGYRLERPLGAGGMADVWLGRGDNGSLAAVKLLRASSGETMRELFVREQRAVLSLQHPHLVPVFDVGDDYIAGAYIDGADLRHRMRSPISV